MAQRYQLPQGGAPLPIVQFAPHSENGDLVVPELLDALGCAPNQDIDQVHRAEALSGPIGAGQQFLGDDLTVTKLRRRHAVIAIAASDISRRFAEVSEQPGASA